MHVWTLEFILKIITWNHLFTLPDGALLLFCLQALPKFSYIFFFFDPKYGLLDPKNLGKESKQLRNRAKFHLSCFQRFGNRFGIAEGAAPYKA